MSGMKFEKEIFMKYLIEREASEATKKKYMTDVTTFYSYAADEYSCAVTPQVRQTGNRLSGLAGTAYASLLT